MKCVVFFYAYIQWIDSNNVLSWSLMFAKFVIASWTVVLLAFESYLSYVWIFLNFLCLPQEVFLNDSNLGIMWKIGILDWYVFLWLDWLEQYKDFLWCWILEEFWDV